MAHLEEDDAQAVHVHLLGVVRGAAALTDLRGDVERRPDLAGQAVVRGGVGVAVVRGLGDREIVQGDLGGNSIGLENLGPKLGQTFRHILEMAVYRMSHLLVDQVGLI